MIALSFDAHWKTAFHVLKNTHQCLRGYSLAFFLNSGFQIIDCVDKPVPSKWCFLNEETGNNQGLKCRPEISIDQPIVKKMPQITKSENTPE
jgi:hypothetical protein